MRVNKTNLSVLLCCILIALNIFIPIYVIGQKNHFTMSNQNLICSTGVIVYHSFEGGFFGIISDDGKNYEPINLPPMFELDGLRVIFIGQILDLGSFRMSGRVMRILFIIML